MATLAKMAVEVGADISGFTGAMDKVESRSSGLASKMGSILNLAGGFGVVQMGLNLLGGAFDIVKGSIIGMNSTLETSTLQFQTLMGDADRAKEHVAGLFEFAKATPFETGPIIQASKLLQTFGGDALNTKDNLTLFGDAAAATSTNIDELSFWSGRMYAALQAGKPIGEMTSRLSELAVLSPQATVEMEKMMASGASAEEVWATYTQSLEKFTGAMELQSGTWSGLVATFQDTLAIAGATAFKPFFDLAKGGLGQINTLLEKLGDSGVIEKFASGLANGVSKAVVFVKDLAGNLTSLYDLVVNGKFDGNLFGLKEDSLPVAAILNFRKNLENGIQVVKLFVGEILSEFNIAKEYTNNIFERIGATLDTVFGGITKGVGPLQAFGAQVNNIFNVVKSVIQSFASEAMTIFSEQGIVAGINFLLDALSKISPLVEAMRTIISEAGPAILTVITETFGIVLSFIQENGASIMSTVMNLWNGAREIIDVAVQGIASVVSLVMTTIADFMANNGENIKETLSRIWNTAATVVNAAITLIRDYVVPVFQEIVSFITSHSETIKTVLQAAWDMIRGIIQIALSVIEGVVNTVMAVIKGDWEGAWTAIKDMFSGIWEGIQTYFTGAIEIFKVMFTTFLELVKTVWNDTWSAAFAIAQLTWDTIVSFFQLTWQGISDLFSFVFGGIWNFTVEIFNNIKDSIMTAVNYIKDNVTIAVGFLKDRISETWGLIRDKTSEIWNTVYMKIQDTWNRIKEFVSTSITAVLGTVTNMAQSFYNAGSALVNMLLDGIKAAWGGMISWVKDGLQELRNMLPFSEPRDKTSPLYGLGDSGKAIIGMIQGGMDSAPPLTVKKAAVDPSIMKNLQEGVRRAVDGATAAESLRNSIMGAMMNQGGMSSQAQEMQAAIEAQRQRLVRSNRTGANVISNGQSVYDENVPAHIARFAQQQKNRSNTFVNNNATGLLGQMKKQAEAQEKAQTTNRFNDLFGRASSSINNPTRNGGMLDRRIIGQASSSNPLQDLFNNANRQITRPTNPLAGLFGNANSMVNQTGLRDLFGRANNQVTQQTYLGLNDIWERTSQSIVGSLTHSINNPLQNWIDQMTQRTQISNVLDRAIDSIVSSWSNPSGIWGNGGNNQGSGTTNNNNLYYTPTYGQNESQSDNTLIDLRMLLNLVGG